MKKITLIFLSIIAFSCSNDDEKNCDCDKVEYGYLLTFDRNSETFSMQTPDVDEEKYEEREREFYGVDCSEDDLILREKSTRTDLPQQIHFSYSKTEIECN